MFGSPASRCGLRAVTFFAWPPFTLRFQSACSSSFFLFHLYQTKLKIISYLNSKNLTSHHCNFVTPHKSAPLTFLPLKPNSYELRLITILAPLFFPTALGVVSHYVSEQIIRHPSCKKHMPFPVPDGHSQSNTLAPLAVGSTRHSTANHSFVNRSVPLRQLHSLIALPSIASCRHLSLLE